jgi:FixJ family two-component response regulator
MVLNAAAKGTASTLLYEQSAPRGDTMPQTPQTICIIEDDESVRRALRRLVKSVGYNVEDFATAEEFLQSCGQTQPNCLILDVHLPGLSGLDLQRLLRAEGRPISFVVITAYGDEKMREQALQDGATAFLPKPFEELSLLEAVDRALN